MKKFGRILTAAFLLSFSLTTTAFAGTWKQDTSGWWYQNDDGSYPKSIWQWIDGNGDGIAESYCFDANGYLYTNTTTPDGYTVNRDGAWMVDGIVRQAPVSNTAVPQTPAGETGVFRAATDADKQMLLDATKKTNALTSMAAKSIINMNMSMDGQSVQAAMDMDMKFKNLNTNNMQYLVNTRIDMLGVKMDGYMFYTNGYYYMNMAGEKMKVPMDLDSMVQQVNTSTNTLGLSSLDYYQNLQVLDDGYGNKTFNFSCDPSQMSGYINSVYSQMGLTATNANIKAINGSIYLTNDGYCGAQSINMNVDITSSGQTVSADMAIYIGYINPGQPVDFTLPSTEGYTEGL